MFQLTEVDKITLRKATPDQLLWLWRRSYRHDPDHRGMTEAEGEKVMQDLLAKADASFEASGKLVFGQTWLF